VLFYAEGMASPKSKNSTFAIAKIKVGFKKGMQPPQKTRSLRLIL
jgi:hypothetical protein